MEFQREDDVTTYEWAVKVYDSFPNDPTRLEAGKKLGFEVAVLDKDKKRPRSLDPRPPSFRTWAFPRWSSRAVTQRVSVSSPSHQTLRPEL